MRTLDYIFIGAFIGMIIWAKTISMTLTNNQEFAKYEKLEERLNQLSTRPTININRAAVYNSDGELIIKELKGKGIAGCSGGEEDE